jgi:SsrA-binding protein
MNERGYSLIPLRLYFRGSKVKLLLALAKGKRKYDKRESIREREQSRDLDRQRKEYK